ncbi:hypothetical protein Glove_155g72 [Diversispora epigaea]|uniref:Protein kinase domain-containing protein n=1 Tax=Diversispora epigaea TaxID=1348612 RepID=A0A397J0M0_9GLOM|nr:hypothetical protein Glove_155g72 [Diversispora epigaea]
MTFEEVRKYVFNPTKYDFHEAEMMKDDKNYAIGKRIIQELSKNGKIDFRVFKKLANNKQTVDALLQTKVYIFVAANNKKIFTSTAEGLGILHAKNLIHCNLNSGNILNFTKNRQISYIDLDLNFCKLENDLILNANDKNNKIYGSIPYIPHEVLGGNKFTKKDDIYSFGGIMYEVVTAQRPLADQAHDNYLMIDM